MLLRGDMASGARVEMLVVETIARIGRDHFVKGKSIKAIVRDRGVSRNTVRKVVRSSATAFNYERREQPFPKLGAFIAEPDQEYEAQTGLKTNTSKVSAPRKLSSSSQT